MHQSCLSIRQALHPWLSGIEFLSGPSPPQHEESSYDLDPVGFLPPFPRDRGPFLKKVFTLLPGAMDLHLRSVDDKVCCLFSEA